MKHLFAHKSIFFMIVSALSGLLLLSAGLNGQTKYQSGGGVKLVIEGTSNLHDWDLKSEKGAYTAVLEINNTGAPTGLSTLSFTVPAESLKSDHKAMDKNTYKALGTDKHASISFTAGTAVIKPAGGNNYQLTANGKLTISGVTKDVQLTASGVMNPDKSITYSGSYQLKMTDYNVAPPTAVFGTIKTGDKITVKFSLVLKSI